MNRVAKKTKTTALSGSLAFTAEGKPFAGALAAAVSVVAGSATLPIWETMLIEAGDGHVRLTATDFQRQVVADFPAEVEIEGAICAPGRVLAGLVNRLAKGDVDIQVRTTETDGGERLEIREGDTRAHLVTLPAEEFPTQDRAMEGATVFEIDGASFQRLLNKTQHAMSSEETRYYLNGVYLCAVPDAHEAGVLRAVATDGHRLALIDAEMPADAAGMPGVIIPRTAVDVLLRLTKGAPNLTLEISDKAVKVRMPGSEFLCKLIDGTYPDYERVIPQGGETLLVERKELAEAGGARGAAQERKGFRRARRNIV